MARTNDHRIYGFILGSLHSQDLSDEQRKERCQNNKNRVAELEIQLRVVNTQLANAMTQQEIDTARSQMVFVRRVKNEFNQEDDTEMLLFCKLQVNIIIVMTTV